MYQSIHFTGSYRPRDFRHAKFNELLNTPRLEVQRAGDFRDINDRHWARTLLAERTIRTLCWAPQLFSNGAVVASRIPSVRNRFLDAPAAENVLTAPDLLRI